MAHGSREGKYVKNDVYVSRYRVSIVAVWEDMGCVSWMVIGRVHWYPSGPYTVV